jgi:hypothetical protein
MVELPDLRVSDQEREVVAQELRDHFAAGRLSDDELSERLERAYGAKTAAELAALRADLPAPSTEITVATPRQLARRRAVHDIGAVALVNVGAVVIWAATGAGGSFWPEWVILLSAFRVAYDCWNLLGPNGDKVAPEYRTWVERRLRP